MHSSAKDPLGSRHGAPAGRASDGETVSRISRTRHHRETLEFRYVASAIGRFVRALRQERGWTVEQAAGHFGIEPAFVRRIESGRTNPSLAIIVSIARAFLRAEDLAPGPRSQRRAR